MEFTVACPRPLVQHDMEGPQAGCQASSLFSPDLIFLFFCSNSSELSQDPLWKTSRLEMSSGMPSPSSRALNQSLG